jgi:hypothetical protein
MTCLANCELVVPLLLTLTRLALALASELGVSLPTTASAHDQYIAGNVCTVADAYAINNKYVVYSGRDLRRCRFQRCTRFDFQAQCIRMRAARKIEGAHHAMTNAPMVHGLLIRKSGRTEEERH